jgi:hypothetical protein
LDNNQQWEDCKTNGKVTTNYLEHPKCNFITFVTKLEEPCEGRLSRTVLWEGRGAIPLPDPIGSNTTKIAQKNITSENC